MNNKLKNILDYVGLNSLRGRYLYVVFILTFMFLATAWLGQSYLSETSGTNIYNSEKRNNIIFHTTSINNAVRSAEDDLSAYMKLPNDQHRDGVLENLNLSIKHAELLSHQEWPNNIGIPEKTSVLQKELAILLNKSKELIDIRLDLNRLFPAMKIIRDSMTPANMEFISAANIAVNEIRSKEQKKTPEYYFLFDEVRYNWSQMISAFRIYYSASWLGNYGDPKTVLLNQSRNVEILHNDILQKLEQIDTLIGRKNLDFILEESYNNMEKNAYSWLADYKIIRDINNSNAWRTDIDFYNNEIEPLLLSTHEKLFELSSLMEASSMDDISSINDTAYKISSSQITVTIIVLLIAWSGYFYFEVVVIRPINQIARALDKISVGEKNVRLPKFMANEIKNLVNSFTYMRDQINKRQSELEHQALHDSLTGLPNRVLLLDRLEHSIHAAKRDNESLALIMLDLDRFKEVNDTLGHHAGDIVLIEMSKNFIGVLRESDTIARLGGDEFAILLPNTDAAHARSVANKIVTTMEKAVLVEGQKLHMTGSIGITLFPLHGDNSKILLQRADVAMYMSKRSNDNISFYDEKHDPNSISRLSLISDLHKAIERDELELYFQPKLDINSNSIQSAEVLLRWNHSERGFIPPDEIVMLAEYTGIIKSLTSWVLTEAIKQSSIWMKSGIDLQLSVNLSVWNLQDHNLKYQIRSLLESWGVPARNLSLEITESSMMADPAKAMDTLNALDKMNLYLSVDDFGTGFSSLAYLKKLPVNELKIDKSFVMGMLDDANDGTIVRSTIDLAHNLGLKVVAEGVENEKTLDMLKILGCDVIQGYHLGKPMPAGQFVEWFMNFSKVRSIA